MPKTVRNQGTYSIFLQNDEENDVKVKTIEGREIQRTKWKTALEKQLRRKRELIG